jgi:tetrahydromethanopterin S-methyltransferase subunit G
MNEMIERVAKALTFLDEIDQRDGRTVGDHLGDIAVGFGTLVGLLLFALYAGSKR